MTPAEPAPRSGAAVARPLRADARRNRARLLDVADAVFAAKGVGASTEEIARAAGVGIGTVFRHFPTKEALLAAVFVGRLQRLADEAAARATAEDPAAALFGFLAYFAEQTATKNAFAEALAEAGVDVDRATTAIKDDFRAALGTLLRRAQEAGAVRPDIGVTELIALLVGISRMAEFAGADPAVRDRTLAVVSDGLRLERRPSRSPARHR
jgi:AcrR family transcriptional regulator